MKEKAEGKMLAFLETVTLTNPKWRSLGRADMYIYAWQVITL